ncbi:hypothetical protein FLK61_31705 [Paenalkalicoccus suaedae]|uniref:Uncharacterized protein n=1 Tax=Paenalkalicoccus suaedae TaxID=2592382 RepID=A0A859FDW0_9BACI|nr:hypothetical protein [Paenalkalicoccus suaedae]QKS71277.1 hypothetical protein FLK61_31705 [Paenalkalicoccus suaedae]
MNRLLTLLSILAYLSSIFYLIDAFFVSIPAAFLSATLSAILVLATLFTVKWGTKMIVTVLLAIGFYVFMIERASISTILLAFGTNATILSLFLLIPLVGTYMSSTGFLHALKENVVAYEAKHGNKPYKMSYGLMMSIAFILNFGTIAIVKQIADESFRGYREKKLTLHIMRGFAFCMLWSPYFVNVGLVLTLFYVSWFDIAVYGLGFAFVYACLSALFLPLVAFKDDPVIEKLAAPSISKASSIRPLVQFSLIFVLLSFTMYYALDATMLAVVSLLAIFMPIVYSIFRRDTKIYTADAITQMSGAFTRLKNELGIFIAAGFFGTALALTSVGDYLSTMLVNVANGSIFIVIVSVMIVTVALSMIGVHPIIVIIGLSSSLHPDTFGVTPVFVAMLLLLSWTLATQVSPFSGQMLMSARLIKTPALQLSKQNALFIATCFICFAGILYALERLGLI